MATTTTTDGVTYRRAKLWQIILVACNAFNGMAVYSLIGLASYSASVGYGIATVTVGLLLTFTRIFDAITDDLAPRGIEFTYDFDAVHDRFIHLDNGWKINLGRGLDIFDKVERFSIDRISQEDRRCKACSISFVRDEDQEVPGSL